MSPATTPPYCYAPLTSCDWHPTFAEPLRLTELQAAELGWKPDGVADRMGRHDPGRPVRGDGARSFLVEDFALLRSAGRPGLSQSLTYLLVASIVSHGRLGAQEQAAFAQGNALLFLLGALGAA